jgi:hypothetical protein
MTVAMVGASMMRRLSTRGTQAIRGVTARTLLFRSLLVLAVLVAGTAAFACVLLFTDWGRAKVAREAEQLVNAGIHGQLRIASIDRIDLPFVEARGVQLVAPSGVPAIDVKHVIIELDFAALWDGRFAWHRADIHGGIVRVTEDKQGRVNMEETFRARATDSKKEKAQEEKPQPSDAEGPLDLRTMVTSDMTLVIGGGSLPKLRMENLYGIMRVRVLANEQVTLRFDEYRGNFVEGLPTGRLDFRDVKGHVTTDQRRLLYFQGRGKSEGEPVAFDLDIHTEPTQVKIDAEFPRLSAESLATLAFAGYTRFDKDLELNVKPGRIGGDAGRIGGDAGRIGGDAGRELVRGAAEHTRGKPDDP